VPCFSSEQVSKIVSEANGWYRAYFATAALVGLRAGELAGLRTETGDVDLVRKLIHVRRGVFDGEEQSPKSRNAYRWVPIDNELAAILKAHIGDRKFGYVFQSRNGSPVRLNNILRRVLHPILRKLNIPMAGMHAFRHHRCSFLVENNVPLAVKQWLGHGGEKMIQRYTHHRPEFHSAILAQLPTIISGQMAVVVPNSPTVQFDSEKEVA
jgi:integrase